MILEILVAEETCNIEYLHVQFWWGQCEQNRMTTYGGSGYPDPLVGLSSSKPERWLENKACKLSRVFLTQWFNDEIPKGFFNKDCKSISLSVLRTRMMYMSWTLRALHSTALQQSEFVLRFVVEHLHCVETTFETHSSIQEKSNSLLLVSSQR